MKLVKVLKALGNQKRLDILRWLKDPEAHFPPHQEVDGFGHGVCVAFIQRKCGMSQSTTSQNMALLENVGLVKSTRIGKWTYYKRNGDAIRAFLKELRGEL